MASSSVMADSSVSASQYDRGTSRVNRHAPSDARRRTSASNAGVAAVRLATINTLRAPDRSGASEAMPLVLLLGCAAVNPPGWNACRFLDIPFVYEATIPTRRKR